MVLQELFSFIGFCLLSVGLNACAIDIIFRNLVTVPMSSSLFPNFSSIRIRVISFYFNHLLLFSPLKELQVEFRHPLPIKQWLLKTIPFLA